MLHESGFRSASLGERWGERWLNARLSAPGGRCYAVPGSGGEDERACDAMRNKRERQALILELVQARPVSSQEDLRRLLAARGLDVTQATLSRDLRDLGLARVTTEDGVRYVVPEALADDSGPALGVTLAQFFASIDGVGELIVLRALPGGAQPVAEAIDAEAWPEVLGTIGGENTILVVCRSAEARTDIMRRLKQIAGRA
jgi:transcriptional regulator of arginine metabolism